MEKRLPPPTSVPNDSLTRCSGSVARPSRNRPLPRNRFEQGQKVIEPPLAERRRNSSSESHTPWPPENFGPTSP